MKSLVKRAQRGDDQAFVELIEENKQAMYKVAVGILKNDFDAADAIQQSILTCYEKLKELEKAQYFKTWLLRILINNCNQMLREQKKVVGIEDYYGAEDTKGKKAEEKKELGLCCGKNSLKQLPVFATTLRNTAISGCIDFILCRRDEHTGNQSNTTDE